MAEPTHFPCLVTPDCDVKWNSDDQIGNWNRIEEELNQKLKLLGKKLSEQSKIQAIAHSNTLFANHYLSPCCHPHHFYLIPLAIPREFRQLIRSNYCYPSQTKAQIAALKTFREETLTREECRALQKNPQALEALNTLLRANAKKRRLIKRVSFVYSMVCFFLAFSGKQTRLSWLCNAFFVHCITRLRESRSVTLHSAPRKRLKKAGGAPQKAQNKAVSSISTLVTSYLSKELAAIVFSYVPEIPEEKYKALHRIENPSRFQAYAEAQHKAARAELKRHLAVPPFVFNQLIQKPDAQPQLIAMSETEELQVAEYQKNQKRLADQNGLILVSIRASLCLREQVFIVPSRFDPDFHRLITPGPVIRSL